jgi:hypothetical protein
MGMRLQAARAVAMVGALVGWAALLLQFGLLMASFRAEGGTALGGIWRFFGFFTILSNILAAIVLTHAALKPRAATGLTDPPVELAVTTAMALVGIVYAVVLRALWEPQGWQKLADVALHDAMPIIVVLFFLLRGHGALRWRDAITALTIPVGYGLYALARGAIDGWYAYPFLDAGKLSAVQMAVNMAGLTLGVLALALLLIAVAKLVTSQAQ